MDLFNTFKPIPVTCDYCFKEFSSSTILFHQKKHHQEQPYKYSPQSIQCEKCLEIVPISGLSMHNSICDKKCTKEQLHTIIEEFTGAGRAICRYCRRKFAPERIDKHQSACETASKKRPLFDILKKRIPFLNDTMSKQSSKRSSIKLNYPNSKWQKQHLQLIKNLRNEEEDSIYDDYINCPHCSRKFAPIVAEKHIDICKNIVNKPKPPPSVISQRFPSVKKLDPPLTIRTNSLKAFLRPSSVNNNSCVEKKFSVNVLSNSIEEPNSPTSIADRTLSPVRMPPLRPETNKGLQSEKETLFPTSKGLKKTSELKKKLRPSATVKHIERGSESHNSSYRYSKHQVADDKRSISTQRMGESAKYCHLCKAGIPPKARFCMMCGTLRPN